MAWQEKGQAALAERLPKSLGWGMGLEFRESQLQLTARNAVTARPGMVFNVALGAPVKLRFKVLGCSGMVLLTWPWVRSKAVELAVHAYCCSLQGACTCDSIQAAGVTFVLKFSLKKKKRYLHL